MSLWGKPKLAGSVPDDDPEWIDYGPLYDEEGVLYADLDPAVLLAERQRFDPAGHYHRPDVLQLKVKGPR